MTLAQALEGKGIDVAWLPRTESEKHIWARDYMPVQLEKDLFLLYRYQPDYLQGYRGYIPDYGLTEKMERRYSPKRLLPLTLTLTATRTSSELAGD